MEWPRRFPPTHLPLIHPLHQGTPVQGTQETTATHLSWLQLAHQGGPGTGPSRTLALYALLRHPSSQGLLPKEPQVLSEQ